MQAPNRVGSSDREKELERRVESLQQQLERALAENERLRNNWNKRCELTSEAPHRFPRGNPKVTLSRRDASLDLHDALTNPPRLPENVYQRITQ